MTISSKEQSCICSVVEHMKKEQDKLAGCATSCFSSLEKKLLKADTIPFMLFSCEPFTAYGLSTDECDQEGIRCFTTKFFRIEEIKPDSCCATISLLRPLDCHGFTTEDFCETHSLEKTNICLEVDLSCFCAVSCLDIKMMKKREHPMPKW